MNKIRNIFLTITSFSLLLMIYIYYNDTEFKNNPLSNDIKLKISQKENHIRKLIIQKYGLNVKIPIIISNKIPDNLYGLAAYNEGYIKIVLNKNRFKESEDYMIDYVLPHEYAHALMFVLSDFPSNNGGHSKRWQNICLNLDGKKCDRFVKHKDIVMGKLDFLY